MMTTEGSTKIVNFMNPGVLVLGYGYISHIIYRSKNALSSTPSIYSTLIAIVLWDYIAAFLCHCRFYFFYDVAIEPF